MTFKGVKFALKYCAFNLYAINRFSDYQKKINFLGVTTRVGLFSVIPNAPIR